MKLQQIIKPVSLLLCGAMLSATALAGEQAPSATPYRPTVSNPAELSEPGWLELEFGGQYIKGGGDKARDSLPLLAKLAFSENWGILLGGELAVRRTDLSDTSYSGAGDTTLLLKHRIPTNTEDTAWGVEMGYKFPTAKSTIGSGKPDFLLNGIYSIDLSCNHLDFNLGATRVSAVDIGVGRLQYNWAASLSRNLNEQWGVFGELSGVSQHGAPALSQVMTGATYNLSNKVVLDAGATAGLANASQNWSVFAGVTVLLEKLW